MNEALESEMAKKVHVSGIAGITGGSVREIRVDRHDPDTGELQARKEWVVDTEGTALEKLLALDFVDPTRTFSNDVTEIEEVFGIEAAAAVLFHELKQVIYFGGTYIDPRHILLLSHTMTHLGYQVALSRFGINRLETGPLVKISFEQTYEVVNQAAVQAQVDAVQGPTPSVMMGQLGPLPTGVVEVRPTPEYLLLVAQKTDTSSSVACSGDGTADAPKVARSAKLAVSVPRERPRRAPTLRSEPDAVRHAAGPDPEEASVLVRKRPAIQFEDERAVKESSAPKPSSEPPSRKKARPAPKPAVVVDVALEDPLLVVREDSIAWPPPERMMFFRDWPRGSWTPAVLPCA